MVKRENQLQLGEAIHGERENAVFSLLTGDHMHDSTILVINGVCIRHVQCANISLDMHIVNLNMQSIFIPCSSQTLGCVAETCHSHRHP